MSVYEVSDVKCQPFNDQAPGTSGLRKNVNVFMRPNYTECFIQSILNSLGDKLEGCTLVVGGDGRYFVKEATNLILNMCVANKVGKVYVGCNGILSTPAASNLIRLNSTDGGIILTASHNPGGPQADFGIKFNVSNGGPAPVSVTDEIFKISKTLQSFKIAKDLNFDIRSIKTIDVKTTDGSTTTVEVIDPVECYVTLMKSIFDFDLLKSFTCSGQFKGHIDCMNGVTGPYAKAIFVEQLGFQPDWVVNDVPKTDFGGIHPDPNLIHATDLVEAMKKGDIDFGAAFDGDGDRNMVLGQNAFFVTPGDSLALFLENLHHIPYFQGKEINGVARSMPTSFAVDKVARSLDIELYETPTGWKFFGNLMDSNRISLCGEESFGQGSTHIREKDGIWAVLVWLTILATSKQSIPDILQNHWKEYGRTYALRYDYENIDNEIAAKVMAEVERAIDEDTFVGSAFGVKRRYIIESGENFSYTDVTDGSVVSNQGLKIVLTDGSRIIYRLSGTGTSSATIRMYFDTYDYSRINEEREEILEIIIDFAHKLSKFKEITNVNAPTVIT